MPKDSTQKLDIGKFYEENFEKLYKFFYYKVLSRDIAEDLTSETFMTFVNIIKGESYVEKPSHFLYGVAKNIFLKYLKDKYRQGLPFSDLGDDFENYATRFVEERESSESLEDKLLKYIEKIPDKQQLVMRLRFLEKLTLKEICLKIGKDMNYVKTMQKRGLRSLKDLLELVE